MNEHDATDRKHLPGCNMSQQVEVAVSSKDLNVNEQSIQGQHDIGAAREGLLSPAIPSFRLTVVSRGGQPFLLAG